MAVMARLAKFEKSMLVFRDRYASRMIIDIPRQVSIYIEMLISLELLVLSNLIVCGTPEIRKNMPGR